MIVHNSVHDLPQIDPMQFRKVLSKYATGVAVVTGTDDQEKKVGLTINSFASVSLDPPLILWSISKNSMNKSAFEEGKSFCVSILSDSQEDVAKKFCSKDEDRFSGIDIGYSEKNNYYINDSAGYIECVAENNIDSGDHIIIIGKVESIQSGCEASNPLVFHNGKFKNIK